MDPVSRKSRNQIVVWVLIGLVAGLAALPGAWASRLNLDTEFLLGVLGLLIVLALFLYARFSYFFLTVLLIVGANLPQRWSLGLDIDRTPLIFALALMIVASLLNQVTRVLPTGLEPKVRQKNPEGIRALMAAIGRGQERSVKSVVAMHIDLDDFDEPHRSPLMAAAAAGHAGIVEILLAGGADPALRSPDGQSAIDLALAAGHTVIADRLKGLVAQSENNPPSTVPDLTLRIGDSQH